MTYAARHHWLNTIVGMLDAAFALTEAELFFCEDIVGRLLEALHIPERCEPVDLPAVVAHEIETGVLAQALWEQRHAGVVRRPRVVAAGDVCVHLEAWRDALLTLVTVAYPDLDPIEVVAAEKVLDDLLLALGLPERSAAFVPDDVVRAHRAGA